MQNSVIFAKPWYHGETIITLRESHFINGNEIYFKLPPTDSWIPKEYYFSLKTQILIGSGEGHSFGLVLKISGINDGCCSVQP